MKPGPAKGADDATNESGSGLLQVLTSINNSVFPLKGEIGLQGETTFPSTL
jgi:hypothetical protein